MTAAQIAALKRLPLAVSVVQRDLTPQEYSDLVVRQYIGIKPSNEPGREESVFLTTNGAGALRRLGP